MLKETGSLKAQYKETRESKIDIKKLEAELERKPDATFGELAKIFKCTDSAIFYALKRGKLTLKKTFSYEEQSWVEVILYIMKLIYMVVLAKNILPCIVMSIRQNPIFLATGDFIFISVTLLNLCKHKYALTLVF